ncbi:MAG: AAA family ATPase [Firmicutes bacterium]|nr:AAA family ATPase [Bacillota bacterium]
MRIEYLYLPAFGLFTDERIEFPLDKSLHIIYGRNEAGKSTLLRAVSDALFGPIRSSGASFRHPPRALRIEAGLRLADGTRLLFRRRSGTRSTLRDLEDKPLDEDILLPFTCGLERSEYENMFGLDHLRLREGGQRLLEAGGSLGESLFAAASGLHELRRRLEELSNQAGALFKPTASKPEVNSLAKQFRELKQSAANAALSPRQFAELESNYLHQQELLASLERQLEAAERRRQRLQRIQRTKPLLAERQAVLASLQSLGELPALAPDSQERFSTYSTLLRQAQERRGAAERRWALLHQELEALQLPQGILDQEETINLLQQGLGQYRQAVQDLPVLRGQVDTLEQSALGKLRELNPFAQDLQAGEQFRLPIHLREAVHELSDLWNSLAVELAQAQEAAASRIHDLQATQQVLERFGALADISGLQALLAELSKAGDLEAACAQQEQLAADLQASAALERERLPLWPGNVEQLVTAELPLPASVAACAAQAEELAQKRRELGRAMDSLKARRAALIQELAGLEAAGPLVTPQELHQARAYRDQGWQLIRRAWLDGVLDREQERAFAGHRPLAEAYEQSVTAADQKADELWRAADRAARRQALVEQLAAVERELEERAGEAAALDQQEAEFQHKWEQLWRPVGIKPLSPKEMLEWLQRCLDLCELFQRARQAERAAEELEQKKQSFIDKLSAALQAAGADAQGGLVELKARAERICQEELERRGVYNSLTQRLREQQLEAARAQRRVEELLAQQEQWEKRWQHLLTEVGLPAGTTPQAAKAFLAQAQELVELLDKLALAKRSACRQQKFIEEYRLQAYQAAQQAHLDIQGMDAAVVVEHLGQLSRDASRTLATRREKEKQLAELGESLSELGLQIAQAQEGLNALLTETGAADFRELEDVLNRHAQAVELRGRLVQLERQLLQMGDGLSLEELAEEAESVDLDAAAYQLQLLTEEMQRLRQDKVRLHEGFGVLKKEYEAVVQGSAAEAAEAAERAQEVLAGLAKAAGRYLQLRTAALVLQRAMERYQEEYQNPVLHRAGRIFERLTGGSFQGLAVDYDHQGRPVIRGVRGEELVGVEGMSDGTQDQLYLALRLASIEGFLEQGEPLPFIADDLLVNFDDLRTAEALQVLADLSGRTQVILFTHHLALVDLARKLLPANVLSVHVLGDALAPAGLGG